MSGLKKWIFFGTYIFFCLTLFLTSSNDFSQDLGRHLVLGKTIVETKQIPKTNLFSFTYPHYPFVNHHWLSEVIFYLISSWFGNGSLIVLKAVLIIGAICTVLCIQKSTLSFAVAFFYSFFLLDRDYVRPELFSYLFFALILFILFHRSKQAKLPVYIPFIYLVWINTHISFIFGLILLLFIFISMKKTIYNLLLILLSIFALFINPNGIQGVIAPFTIFQNYGYSIVENQNMFFLMQATNNMWIVLYFMHLPLLIGILILLSSQKKWNQVTLLFLFSLFPIIQIRHLPFFILCAIAVIPQLSFCVQNEFYRTIKKGLALGLPLTFIFTSVLLSTNLIYETFDIRKTFGISFERVDDGLTDFVKEKRITHFFNNFDIGSYLIYRLYPRHKVFVDGRPEAYPSSFFQSVYIPLQQEKTVQQKVFNQYHINTILFSHTDQTPWGSAFLERISSDTDWKMIYADRTFVVFQKDDNGVDIRQDLHFLTQVENENNFFYRLQYARLLVYLQNTTLAQRIMKQAVEDRPHSCTILKYKQSLYGASIPFWCSLQSLKMF